MTAEDREFLNQINAFAEEVIEDVNPEKVRISEQLDMLRPILEKLALVYSMPVEEVFLKYMDLATEAAVEREAGFKEAFKEILNPPE